ncbi:hypothetical protein F4778DRAFT_79335 [Xylariomycetidae sp. FL2044]|nr:hypothetical protein F4778DRAFT_79335 [Xylariomycetidae sp. FL2044]
MADSIADQVKKAPSSTTNDATVPATDAALPPITKAPMNTAEASMVPTVPPGSEAAAPSAVSSSEPATQNKSATSSANDELAKKMKAADELALQPEKPTDFVPASVSHPATTDVTETGAPSLPNGEAKDLPKPVSVEEVRDQDLPAVKPLETAEVTDVLQPGETSAEASIIENATVATEAKSADVLEAVPASTSAVTEETAKANAGDKRKADAETSNGKVDESVTKNDTPDEKKQKTNGAAPSAATNGTAKKPGRPKKEKKVSAPVGRTARKTRSQGAVE